MKKTIIVTKNLKQVMHLLALTMNIYDDKFNSVLNVCTRDMHMHSPLNILLFFLSVFIQLLASFRVFKKVLEIFFSIMQISNEYLNLISKINKSITLVYLDNFSILIVNCLSLII